MTLSIRHLDRICLIVTVLLSVAASSWVVYRAAVQYGEIRLEREIQAQRKNDLQKAMTSLQQLQAALLEKRRELVSLNERIPETADVGRLLKDLDGLMKKRQVSLIAMQPLPPVQEKLYVRNPINLTCRGSFANIYHLLHDLESMTRLLETEKLTISRVGDDKLCRVEITATVFERKGKPKES